MTLEPMDSSGMHNCPEYMRISLIRPNANTGKKDTKKHGEYKKSTKLFCRNGHEYTSSTVYVNPLGFRVCKICRKACHRQGAPNDA